MTTTIMAIALVAAGFALSRTRIVKELNSRRFMPAVYAAAAIYFAVRAYAAIAGHERVWPDVFLTIVFLGGAIDSAKAAGIFRKS